MSRDPCVVMVGNISDGFRAVGPFDDFDAAADWCFNIEPGTPSWIMTLNSTAPKDKPKRKRK